MVAVATGNSSANFNHSVDSEDTVAWQSCWNSYSPRKRLMVTTIRSSKQERACHRNMYSGEGNAEERACRYFLQLRGRETKVHEWRQLMAGVCQGPPHPRHVAFGSSARKLLWQELRGDQTLSHSQNCLTLYMYEYQFFNLRGINQRAKWTGNLREWISRFSSYRELCAESKLTTHHGLARMDFQSSS